MGGSPFGAGGTGTSGFSSSGSSGLGSSGAAGLGASGGDAGPGSGGAAGGSAGGAAGTSGGGGGGGIPQSVIDNAQVVLHYQTTSTTASTNTIFMKLFIENKSNDPLPMADVTVRYWFTSEFGPPQLSHPYSAANLVGESLAFTDAGADSYVEVSFTGNTILKGADLNANEFQVQMQGTSTQLFDQSDDYSWQPLASTTRVPNDKITVYLAGTLVWGCEPSGACPGPADGGTGGDAGASSGIDGGAGASGAGTSGVAGTSGAAGAAGI